MSTVEDEQSAVPINRQDQAHLLSITPELMLIIYDYVFADLIARAKDATSQAEITGILQPTIIHICRTIRREIDTKFGSLLVTISGVIKEPLDKVPAALDVDLTQYNSGLPTVANIDSLMVKVEHVQALVLEVGKKMEVLMKISDALPDDDEGFAISARDAMHLFAPLEEIMESP
ncbi:hypothetical protein LTR78_006248 [Recurvomyces mirabilis]|uniref:Uncharacterized protein n=1 Tax=Recurvomyces mirabilis TaxID=574656 RepID=A0AAE0WL39_9PEZI|nr:hypothetical protein LTR78_006248 [Recurvomyces mirabilis]KAK5152137.1 hypothetical protein LTS14_008512 [Recurvomyces mirabilis]